MVPVIPALKGHAFEKPLSSACCLSPTRDIQDPHNQHVTMVLSQVPKRFSAFPPPNMSNARTHTKIAGTPDYDDPIFWDTKFATGQDVGEWLNPGENLVQAVLSHLDNRSFVQERSPRVLHLGPGISKLGTKLREAFVDRDWKGSGIVVSLLTLVGTESLLTRNCHRMLIFRPKPSAWAKKSRANKTRRMQCTGCVLIFDHGTICRAWPRWRLLI